jgi:hypothetical protein
MPAGEEFIRELQRITLPRRRGPVELRVGNGFEDRFVDRLPFVAERLVRLVEKIRLVADREAVERVGVILVDVFREPRGVGGVAVLQAEGVDHLAAGLVREVEQRVDLLRVRYIDARIVHRVGADAQAFDSQRLVDAQEVLVLCIEVVLPIGRQDAAALVTDAEKVRGQIRRVGGGG